MKKSKESIIDTHTTEPIKLDQKTKLILSTLDMIQQSIIQKQKMTNAAIIQEGGTAKVIANYLYNEIINYQENLPDEEDVAMMLVQFNQSIIILVESIGYIGYNLVKFSGKDSSGKPLTLIQHVSQLNFLLKVVPKHEPEVPKRKIGFVAEE